MSREIKFREWCEKLESMIYEPYFHEYNDVNEHFNDEDRILMQCTGLSDKNGVEIYEGDIVMWGSKDRTIDDCNGYGVVEYWDGDACFEITDIKGVTNGISKTSTNEVIGNIYENKELLND